MVCCCTCHCRPKPVCITSRPAIAHKATDWAMRVAFLGESKSKVHQQRRRSDCGQYTTILDLPNQLRLAKTTSSGAIPRPGDCACFRFTDISSCLERESVRSVQSRPQRLQFFKWQTQPKKSLK